MIIEPEHGNRRPGGKSRNEWYLNLVLINKAKTFKKKDKQLAINASCKTSLSLCTGP